MSASCDGQQEALAEDDVDLVGEDLALVAQREHDDVQRVTGLLDLGALVALEDVLGHQRVQAEQLGERIQQRSRSGRSRSIQTRGPFCGICHFVEGSSPVMGCAPAASVQAKAHSSAAPAG